MQNRVVITGLGIWSCLGTTLDEVRDSLYKGKSGIVIDPQRIEMGFRSPLTGVVPMPELKGELSRQQRAFMPEQAMYAYCSTRDALRLSSNDQCPISNCLSSSLSGKSNGPTPCATHCSYVKSLNTKH